MMPDSMVREIAERFIEKHQSPWRYEFAGVNRSEIHPGEASVIFSVTSPDGCKFDGPAIVVVDELTETARWFETL